METAILKCMQMTLNRVSNLVFDGVHLIHHNFSAKSTIHSGRMCRAPTKVNNRLQNPILAKSPDLPS